MNVWLMFTIICAMVVIALISLVTAPAGETETEWEDIEEANDDDENPCDL